MNVIPTRLESVMIVEPKVFGDDRGFFMESFNARQFASATGFEGYFVQDNHSRSDRHVLRGLHYQLPNAQAKLVRCSFGAVWDVAVDIRRSSPTLGEWVGVELSAENRRQLWVPEGFAHGFLVLSDAAELLYKASEYYAPDSEHCIIWDDPALGIEWPLNGEHPVLSSKDESGVLFAEARVFD
jgi:dTDP-4-dehydrorhamnose 3,5-epimerase